MSKPTSLAIETTREHTGQHKLLRTAGVHYQMWDYIRKHPDSFREDVCKATGGNWRRISTLIDEGLVREVDKVKGKGVLRINEGAEVGRGRDTVFVEVAIFRNEFGEYSASCKLNGQMLTATEDNPILVAAKRIDMKIPRPKEKYAERVEQDKLRAAAIETEFKVVE